MKRPEDSARVRAEPQSPDDPAFLRAVLEAMPAFVARIDENDCLAYINRLQPGFILQDVLGQPVYGFLQEEYHEVQRQAIERVRASGEPQRFHCEGAGADGTIAHYDSCLVPIRGHKDICLVAWDVTDHVTRSVALARSEAKLRVAVEAARLGVWSWDLPSNQVEWNQRMFEITGAPEPVAGPEYLERYVHPEDREFMRGDIGRATAGEKPQFLAHRILRPDGQVRWVKPVGTITRDREGRTVGYAGCLLDVTVDTQAEVRLREAQKTDAVGNLTAGVAHNFNNMLGVILPAIDAAIPHTDNHGQGLLREAAEAAGRAAALVSELMTFAGQRRSGKPVTTDMKEVLASVVSICRKTLDRRIDLSVDVPDQLSPVRCDPTAIEQVLLNLVLNARDAVSSPETSQPKIRLSVKELMSSPSGSGRLRQQHVRLRVEDNGIGMTEAVRARLFEPFFTTKPLDKGTGLGLATSQATVKNYGGYIEVDSSPARGSTFDVFLPVTEACASEPTRAPAPPTGSLQGRRVLIVDDEAAVRRVIVAGLTEEGVLTIGASSAEQATLHLESGFSPDLVLLDRSMPGWPAARAVGEIRRLAPKARILFFTGQEVPPQEATLVDGLLRKPMRMTVLREALAAWIEPLAVDPPA